MNFPNTHHGNMRTLLRNAGCNETTIGLVMKEHKDAVNEAGTKPTPSEIGTINQISQDVSELKSKMMHLFSAALDVERDRVLKILDQGRDMDERGNGSLVAHFEWAVKGGMSD